MFLRLSLKMQDIIENILSRHVQRYIYMYLPQNF